MSDPNLGPAGANPASLGFSMPAEWETHKATWLAWPHHPTDWPGQTQHHPLGLHRDRAQDLRRRNRPHSGPHRRRGEAAPRAISSAPARTRHVEFIVHPTNRGWTRDSGPLFVRRSAQPQARNRHRAFPFQRLGQVSRLAEGPPRARDRRQAPRQAALRRASATAGNSSSKAAASRSTAAARCSPPRNAISIPKIQVRNPGPGPRTRFEHACKRYLGVTNVCWLAAGPAGDDTHGHIDDICRFVNPQDRGADSGGQTGGTSTTVRSPKTGSGSRTCAWKTAPSRRSCRCPCPRRSIFEGYRLPASYANFYISNAAVLVPTFNDPNDRVALGILGELFRDRPVVGIHAVDLVLGFGSLHCLTQQEPA